MAFLKFVWRNGLWIAVVAFAVAAAGLAFCILGASGLEKRNELLSVPLLERQDVEFAEAGRVVLCVEGPLLTGRFAGLTYELATPNNAPVKSRATWLHSKSSSFSRVRMEVRVFEVPEPGRYVLRVQGLKGGQAADSQHRLVFTRPHLVQTVGYILGIVFAGMLLVASVVFFGLRFAFGRWRQSRQAPHCTALPG